MVSNGLRLLLALIVISLPCISQCGEQPIHAISNIDSYLEKRFESDRIRTIIKDAIATLSKEKSIQDRNNSLVAILSIDDPQLTAWTLCQPYGEQAVEVLANKKLTPPQVLAILAAIVELSWNDGVVKPVEGDTDDPAGRIILLAKLVRNDKKIEIEDLRRGKQGYYFKGACRAWGLQFLDQIKANDGESKSLQAYWGYASEILKVGFQSGD